MDKDDDLGDAVTTRTTNLSLKKKKDSCINDDFRETLNDETKTTTDGQLTINNENEDDTGLEKAH